MNESPKNPTDKPLPIYCSFCGLSSERQGKIVVGPNVRICDDCIRLCVDIIGDCEPPRGPPVTLETLAAGIDAINARLDALTNPKPVPTAPWEE